MPIMVGPSRRVGPRRHAERAAAPVAACEGETLMSSKSMIAIGKVLEELLATALGARFEILIEDELG